MLTSDYEYLRCVGKLMSYLVTEFSILSKGHPSRCLYKNINEFAFASFPDLNI